MTDLAQTDSSRRASWGKDRPGRSQARAGRRRARKGKVVFEQTFTEDRVRSRTAIRTISNKDSQAALDEFAGRVKGRLDRPVLRRDSGSHRRHRRQANTTTTWRSIAPTRSAATCRGATTSRSTACRRSRMATRSGCVEQDQEAGRAENRRVVLVVLEKSTAFRRWAEAGAYTSNVAITGAWSLVPISRYDGHDVARSASDGAREHVVEPPADVALAQVSPRRPPGGVVSSLGYERSARLRPAPRQKRLQQRALFLALCPMTFGLRSFGWTSMSRARDVVSPHSTSSVPLSRSERA